MRRIAKKGGPAGPKVPRPPCELLGFNEIIKAAKGFFLMKNVWIIVGLLVAGFAGIFFYLHKDGAPSEWERRRQAHAAWKQSAVEPSTSARPSHFEDLKIAPDQVDSPELRLPASEKKNK